MAEIAVPAAPDAWVERLVGRADVLGSLERVLDQLDQGHAVAIALSGEPGIGKTRLLREVAARAEARGHLVLSGSASEFEHDLPFSVFVDALDNYVAGLEPRRFGVLDDQVQAELAHVFPSLWALAEDRVVALQHERYRCHRAVRELLERLAAPKPLVLVLDDFHWADAASVELLGALLRQPPAAAVLIAVALRARKMPERVRIALERAHRAGALTRIELSALTPDEARELVGEAVDAATADVLYQECGGNPFYLEQVVRSHTRAGAVASRAESPLAGIEVPPAVAASLREEIALLSDAGRRVFEGASVAGDPFELESAAAAAATSDAAAVNAVDELLLLDLIRTTDVPRRFRFRHPLVRRAVYEGTAAGWRLGAHERCAAALMRRGATAPARAHHVERSARQGDLGAVATLREAGEDAARLAPASAARWFGAAIRLLPAAAPSQQRVALLLRRAGCLAATGQFAESRTGLLECLDIAAREAKEWRVRVATACAAIEHLLGLQKEAHEHLVVALAALGDAEPAEAVDLMIELTVDASYAVDYDAMRGWADRAVAAAAPLGERSLLAAALCVRAWASAVAGDGEQAKMHCDQATELVDGLSDEELARRLNTLVHLATADLYLDRFAAASRHAKRALDLGRQTGQGDPLPLLVAMLGGSLWVQGRPREAGELFDGAVEAARLAGNAQSLAWSLFNRSFAALVAGELDVALATAEESVELAAGLEPTVISAFAAAVLASVLLETGQVDRSVDLLLTRAGGEELQHIGGGWRARFLEVLTRALLAAGRRAEAERAAAAAQVCAEAVALPSATAMARLATAALDLDAGQPGIAAERAVAAVAALESVAARWDAARARELAGRAFARAGDRDRAARELELAAAAFDSFGSLRYRDQTERELRKLGRRIHRRTRPGSRDAHGIARLTARELEIARLVVDRKTNPEIAAELFLSQKTVETHLRNVFNKMGVAGRVELARAVESAVARGPQGARAPSSGGSSRTSFTQEGP
jgi:DNA-binding CsgD family transcriptional regulator/tetratricopeptide (TPR) repeat protein